MKRKISALLILFLFLGVIPTSASADIQYDTISEVKAYVLSRINMLDEEISFRYTSSLDSEFTDYGPLFSIFDNYGVAACDMNIDRRNREASVTKIHYRQGFIIWRAHSMGITDRILDAEELEVYETAKEIASQALSAGPTMVDIERYIHDKICEMTDYTLSDYTPQDVNFTRYDTAVGVLKYGQAECDGYSDAFFLIGRLAGLTVGFLHGQGGGGGHLWNTIFLDGGWYFVDVTWDDLDYSESPGMVSYRYFNVGADELADHTWEENWTIHPIERSMNWELFPYTWGEHGQQEIGGYVSSAAAACSIIDSYYYAGADRVHILVDGIYDVEQIQKDCANTVCAYTFWTDYLDDYTVIDILYDR